jgi:general stress protein 26
MSLADEAADVSRLLDAAAQRIGKVRYCWLATQAPEGGSRLRPMGRLPRDAGDDLWMLRFLTNGSSPKANDMRREAEVSVIFQDDPNEAYAVLVGRARLIEDKAEIRRRWMASYDAYFPDGPDRSGAIFLTVEVARLELWIRGVTPEPFGMTTTVIERDGGGGWSYRR